MKDIYGILGHQFGQDDHLGMHGAMSAKAGDLKVSFDSSIPQQKVGIQKK